MALSKMGGLAKILNISRYRVATGRWAAATAKSMVWSTFVIITHLALVLLLAETTSRDDTLRWHLLVALLPFGLVQALIWRRTHPLLRAGLAIIYHEALVLAAVAAFGSLDDPLLHLGGAGAGLMAGAWTLIAIAASGAFLWATARKALKPKHTNLLVLVIAGAVVYGSMPFAVGVAKSLPFEAMLSGLGVTYSMSPWQQGAALVFHVLLPLALALLVVKVIRSLRAPQHPKDQPPPLREPGPLAGYIFLTMLVALPMVTGNILLLTSRSLKDHGPAGRTMPAELRPLVRVSDIPAPLADRYKERAGNVWQWLDLPASPPLALSARFKAGQGLLGELRVYDGEGKSLMKISPESLERAKGGLVIRDLMVESTPLLLHGAVNNLEVTSLPIRFWVRLPEDVTNKEGGQRPEAPPLADGGGSTYGEVEPNDATSPQRLSYPAQVAGELVKGDSDTFTVALAEGKGLLARLDGPEGTEAELALLDRQGKERMVSRSLRPGRTDLAAPGLPAGEYLIAVRHLAGPGGGYSLSLGAP